MRTRPPRRRLWILALLIAAAAAPFGMARADAGPDAAAKARAVG